MPSDLQRVDSKLGKVTYWKTFQANVPNNFHYLVHVLTQQETLSFIHAKVLQCLNSKRYFFTFFEMYV